MVFKNMFFRKKQKSQDKVASHDINKSFLQKSSEKSIQEKGLFNVSYVDVSIYLFYGGDAFVKDEKGNSLAHIYPQLTDKLIEKGIDINQQNDEGYTPVMYAALKNQLTVDLIKASSIESLNQVYPNGETVLTAYLSQSGYKDKDVLFALFEKGVDVNQKNQKGMSPLDYMDSYLFEEVAESMIKQGLDVENATYKNKPLSFYLLLEKPSLLLKLDHINLKQKDENGNTLLHYWATDFSDRSHACNIRPALLKKLLEQIDIDAQNYQGETPLLSALKKGRYMDSYMCHGDVHYETVTRESQAKMLLEKGADVSIPDYLQNTALHYASMNGLSEMLPLLVQKGLNIFALNKEGKTAKDYATGIAKEYLKLAEYANEFKETKERYLLCRSLMLQPKQESRTYTD